MFPSVRSLATRQLGA